ATASAGPWSSPAPRRRRRSSRSWRARTGSACTATATSTATTPAAAGGPLPGCCRTRAPTTSTCRTTTITRARIACASPPRVPPASPASQLESEGNDSIANANTLTLANSSPGHLTGTVVGYVYTGDPGNYFKLGNVNAGTSITLTRSQPSTSGLSAVLTILR